MGDPPLGATLPGLDRARERLLREHLQRVPLPRQALLLLERWAEGPGLPPAPGDFLLLLYLAGTSEALTLSLLRRPALLRVLAREGGAAGTLGPRGMEESLGRFLLRSREDAPEARFAAFRMVQSARILVREALGSLTQEQATAELSALADTLIARGFAETFQPLRERLGLPLRPGPDGRPTPCQLAVFALGKLGGGELNYASDVDLVFFYEDEGTTDAGTENSRFFSAWVREATSLLTRNTPDGPALKVDPNLRPRGRDGELTLSFPAALAYFREWADQWERQAWTRARPCAGDPGAGIRFLARLEEVLYKPYAFSGIAFQNREARRKTLQRLRTSRGEAAARDVKEGPGGIRDVEFAVQALQMAHGQGDRWVREPCTPVALARLAQKGYLAEAERASLSRAYALLRKAEHWAQVQGMRQTHDLPDAPEAWEGLARFAGLREVGALRTELESSRAEASRLFGSVCDRLERASADLDEVGRLLRPEDLAANLGAEGVVEPQRAAALLGDLYRALGPYLTTPRRRNHFLRIHYSLLRELVAHPGSRAGLLALHRLLPILEAEPGLLTLALDHPRVPRLVYWLAARSEVLLERMQQWPHLLRRMTYRDFREVDARIRGLAEAEDLEVLRRGQKEVLFLTGARTLLMREEPGWVQERLSAIAEGVLERAFAIACAEVEGTWGFEPGLLRRQVCFLALGRMGTGEMLPRSDLDLVPVKRGPWVFPDEPEKSAAAETALVRRVLDALTAVTRHGALYPVDLRLRPYGSGGNLLASSEALGPYITEVADAWERVAWLKARPVVGSSDLGAQTVREVRSAVFARGLAQEETGRLDELRSRLESGDPTLEGSVKFGEGGLMTADLLLLSAQVRSALDVGPCPRPQLLRHLAAAGAIGEGEAAPLASAVRFQEALLLRLRLKFFRPPDRRRANEVLAALGEEGPEGLVGGWFEQGEDPAVDLAVHWESHRAVLKGAWNRFRERVGG